MRQITEPTNSESGGLSIKDMRGLADVLSVKLDLVTHGKIRFP